jgi:hypothetical protein
MTPTLLPAANRVAATPAWYTPAVRSAVSSVEIPAPAPVDPLPLITTSDKPVEKRVGKPAARISALPMPVVMVGGLTSLGPVPTGSGDGSGADALAARRQVELAEEFLNKIAVKSDSQTTNAENPQAVDASAASDQSWLEAQRQSDDQFRALYGIQAFQGRQIQAAQQDYQQSGK